MELNQLKNLINEKVVSLGFSLVAFSFSKQDVLSLVIDRFEEIDMDTIVRVTKEINAYLDELDPFDKSYTLDVSSLGAEKPLKVDDLHRYKGKYVHVHLINPLLGENIYEGDLLSVDEQKITLSYKDKTRVKQIDISKDNISKVRLAIKF